jgi:hypothetical protein
VLNIVVHKNIRLSEVIVSDDLDSYHLPVIFHLLVYSYIRTRNLSDPVNKFTDWERFQSLAFELISPRIQMNSEEAKKVACDLTASTASAYRLLTSKITLSDLNKDIHGLENLQRLRKLWQVTWDPACKTALKWVAKTIR